MIVFAASKFLDNKEITSSVRDTSLLQFFNNLAGISYRYARMSRGILVSDSNFLSSGVSPNTAD